MNKLGEDILNEIFFMKHNLEFRKCIEQLINLRIKSAFSRFTYKELRGMVYISEGVVYQSLNYNNIDCSCYKILKLIKKK